MNTEDNSPAVRALGAAITAVPERIIRLIKARSQTKEHADLRTKERTASAEQNTKHAHEVAVAHIVRAVITAVPERIIRLITAWSKPNERYADLRSKARTPAAHQLVARIRDDLEELERQGGKRARKRREKSGAKLLEAIERFVGDLLRVRADTIAPALIYRSIGKSSFDHEPVKYDVFTKALQGLKELELVGHRKGQTRYRKAFGASVPLHGRAARFWATGKLLGLAEHYGIRSDNVGEHFALGPPTSPLVLKDYATGRGKNKESGRKVKYEHTTETRRLEADIRELNDFWVPFELEGGEHNGYIRVFNNRSWDKGGRLYSAGSHSHQQMADTERLDMTINGEPVSEIDIKASYLTIYHTMVGEPLKGSGDPYVQAGVVDRSIAKLWTVASFGSSKPAVQWPPDMAKKYKKETGKTLGEQAKARDVGRKMLDAFPALKKLEGHSDIWADLQFREAEAVIGTMMILMRRHHVPSLSMHDGIIVPRSKADLAKATLASEFRRVVGTTPILTVDPERRTVAVPDL